MSTIRENAREAAGLFESATRDSTGEEFRRIREPRPEWVVSLVQYAHAGMLPDDWRYRTIERALDAIADAGDDDDTRETIEDERAEFADGAVDVYTGELLTWLSSSLTRQGYVDEATASFGPSEHITDAIGRGQYLEAGEIFGLVLERLAELSEEDDGTPVAEFVAANRPALIEHVRALVPNVGELDDDDLADWIANDATLYGWARGAGVDV